MQKAADFHNLVRPQHRNAKTCLHKRKNKCLIIGGVMEYNREESNESE